MALRDNFAGPVSTTDLVKSSKHVASLVACNRNKFYCWGCGFFMSVVISEGLLGHLGPLNSLNLALGSNC